MPNTMTSFQTLSLRGVGREFGQFNALKDLTIDVQRGEFIALLGPSGCGKSTALNCIAGLLSTTRGSIWLDDKRIDTLLPEDRGFGMVFQNYALFPHMSVRENIGFGLKMRKVEKVEASRRAQQAIQTVRLDTQADKLPGQLSGGQQQRVAIARAIAIEPPLVLMDEPLSNLDAKLRLEMRQEIRRIHASLGSITIYVTHDQDEALSLADRIVVLREGEIRQIGTPSELYARPAHRDVAEFMGFRNQIVGTIREINGDTATIDIAGVPLKGRAQKMLGKTGIASIRPDDLMPAAYGIPAVVIAMEYRGRDFFGQAAGPGGVQLFFRSDAMHRVGEAVQLGSDPARVIIFSEDAL